MKYRCKQASNSTCGKSCCCADCEDYKKCKNESKCPDAFEAKADCEELVEVGEIISLEEQVPDVIKAIAEICTQKKNLEEQEKKMKDALQKAMEEYGVKKFENDVISVTYVAPTTRTSIDSAKLKKDHPDIAEKYSKTSNVSASIRIGVK